MLLIDYQLSEMPCDFISFGCDIDITSHHSQDN